MSGRTDWREHYAEAYQQAAAWHTQQATEARRKLGPCYTNVDTEAVIRTHQKAAKHFRRRAAKYLRDLATQEAPHA